MAATYQWVRSSSVINVAEGGQMFGTIDTDIFLSAGQNCQRVLVSLDGLSFYNAKAIQGLRSPALYVLFRLLSTGSTTSLELVHEQMIPLVNDYWADTLADAQDNNYDHRGHLLPFNFDLALRRHPPADGGLVHLQTTMGVYSPLDTLRGTPINPGIYATGRFEVLASKPIPPEVSLVRLPNG